MHHSELKRVHRTTRQLKRRQSRTSTSSRLMSSYSTMSSTGRPMEREGSEPQDPPSGKREWGTRILLLIQRPGHPPPRIYFPFSVRATRPRPARLVEHNRCRLQTVLGCRLSVLSFQITKKRTPRPTLWKTRVGH